MKKSWLLSGWILIICFFPQDEHWSFQSPSQETVGGALRELSLAKPGHAKWTKADERWMTLTSIITCFRYCRLSLGWKIHEAEHNAKWDQHLTIALGSTILPFLPSTAEWFLDYILGCWTKQTRDSGFHGACNKATTLVWCALWGIPGFWKVDDAKRILQVHSWNLCGQQDLSLSESLTSIKSEKVIRGQSTPGHDIILWTFVGGNMLEWRKFTGAMESFSYCVSLGTDIKFGLVILLCNLATQLFLVTHLLTTLWLHDSWYLLLTNT